MLGTSSHFLIAEAEIKQPHFRKAERPGISVAVWLLGLSCLWFLPNLHLLAADGSTAVTAITAVAQTKTSELARQAAPQEQRKDLKIVPPVRARIVLQQIDFEGNTAISSSELQKLSEPYLNRPLRYSDLEQLRVEITRAYTDRGYINSGAVLPDQKIENGRLVYRVIEGRLDSIEVSGNERLKASYISSRLRLALDGPFNSEKLTEAFQLLLDDPLIERMDGQLVPMPDKTTALKLNVTPAKPWGLNLTADNHGSPSVGAEQLTFAGSHLNLTGHGDNADLTVSVSPGRYSLSAKYSIPLSASDTRLTIDLGASNSSVVEAPLDDIDIESDSTSIGLSLSHPFRRTLQGSVRLGIDLTVRNSINSLLGERFSFSPGEENGESKVAALRVWQNYTRRTDKRVIALRSSFNFGLDAFGSTIHEDDRPDSEFAAWLGQAQFVNSNRDGGGQLVARLDAQITDDELLPLERFSLGGASSVRGYRKNQLVRDQAVFASLEYRHSLHNSSGYGSWQIAPFLDYGMARGETEEETVFSAGAGLLWSKGRHSAELYLGHAIDETNTSNNDDTQKESVHFRFSTRLH